MFQQWDDLSDDLEVERQMSDSISLWRFLDFPEWFPDFRTVWSFNRKIPASAVPI
ncbi:MAG: hypothetical protein A4E47_00284 [Methanosaeta sp. PtaU1.Bin028]|nr:MAG: hypothetical protein A4E47_00284 [Methanosaeta sp. PtaU1.Bin028]